MRRPPSRNTQRSCDGNKTMRHCVLRTFDTLQTIVPVVRFAALFKLDHAPPRPMREPPHRFHQAALLLRQPWPQGAQALTATLLQANDTPHNTPCEIPRDHILTAQANRPMPMRNAARTLPDIPTGPAPSVRAHMSSDGTSPALISLR